MSVIHKYTLFGCPGHGSSSMAEMHENAQILSCQIQNGSIVVWALHDEGRKVMRTFTCYGTGLNIPYRNRKHISTLQDMNGFVWHIFEEK